jgi:16S rRNA (cytosine1402-N4)-methyltransferase
MQNIEYNHIPVLLDEVIEGLKINPLGIYLDCTLGGAGHSMEIVKKLNKNGILIGIDKDDDAISASTEKLKQVSDVYIFYPDENQFTEENGNLINLKKNFLSTLSDIKVKKSKPTCIIIKSDFKKATIVLKLLSVTKLDGILIDLGVSSHQIDSAERGFSFRFDAPLDMRMDRSQSLTAEGIVNTYSEKMLADLFYKYGEEEFSRSIARNIIKERAENRIQTTGKLNEIIENSMPKKVVFSRGGAAKKVFQALRVEVNNELLELDSFLKDITTLLKKGGRICVISFHSLEDRIVKTVFKELATDCICPPHFLKCSCGHTAEIKLTTRKPITATAKELALNSRSSSAKLRIAEKT